MDLFAPVDVSNKIRHAIIIKIVEMGDHSKCFGWARKSRVEDDVQSIKQE